MDRIWMFFRAVFVGHYVRKELGVVLSELDVLAENIRPLLNKKDRCEALVEFFNLTSPWHDQGLQGLVAKLHQVNWRGRYDSTVEHLRQLQSLFEWTGRNEFGWNRTKVGQVVTEHNVYLGNIFGIWTFPVSHFREGQNDPNNPWKGGGWECTYLEGKNTFEVVSDYQARPFIQKNGRAIIEAVEALRELHSTVV